MKNKTQFPIMINASLVSAQNRKRLFWTNIPNVTLPDDMGILLRDVIETGENLVYQDTYKRLEGKPREHNNKCFTLTSAMGTGGGHVPYLVKKLGKEMVREIDKSCTLRARDWKGFDNYGSTAVIKDSQIRKLTPTECLRLQSMPDDYFNKATYKGKPISNSQRYKMCGNAFCCAVIEHILKQLSPDTNNK
jgi:site-specific DNA-cytosine methylase